MTTPTEAVDRPDEHALAAADDGAQPLLRGLVLLARPHQWIKNLLVFVAPGAAGVLFHPAVFAHAAAAFGIFCLAASGTYYLNDAIDADADRRHPTKCTRPVAAGVVPVPVAVTAGIGMLVVAVVLALPIAGWHLAAVMGAYAGVQLAYSFGLKHEPVLDLACVSTGFILRAVAGGVATSVTLSNWFLIVVSFGSLLVVTGKRSGEKQLLAAEEADDTSPPDARALHGLVPAHRPDALGLGHRRRRTASGPSNGRARCTPGTTRSGSS